MAKGYWRNWEEMSCPDCGQRIYKKDLKNHICKGGEKMATEKKKLNKLIDFKIDVELLAALDSLAIKKGWSRSLVIRQAIMEYIKRRKD